MIEKAEGDEKAHKEARKKKLNDYALALKQEIGQKEQMKRNVADQLEQQRLYDIEMQKQNAQREIERERQYKQKFERFDRDQKERNRIFNDNIIQKQQ